MLSFLKNMKKIDAKFLLNPGENQQQILTTVVDTDSCNSKVVSADLETGDLKTTPGTCPMLAEENGAMGDTCGLTNAINQFLNTSETDDLSARLAMVREEKFLNCPLFATLEIIEQVKKINI